MVADRASDRRLSLNGPNRFRIGLFAANCSSGKAITRVPERWSGSWSDCLRLARLADEAGIEFMLPIGRWKGYGGSTDYQGETLETVTWATALLAKTERLCVFGTVHAPLIHPVIAAKQFVTADHVSEGRFGLNVVCGWNEDEFEMFGIAQRDHDTRYEYAEEWLTAIKRMWGAEEEFDFDGRFLKLKKVRAKPKPYGGSRPLIMNAGASPTGEAFAVRNCDALFTTTKPETLDQAAPHVRKVKAMAAEAGRTIDVYTTGVVTCRANAKEAEEYYRHCMIEEADWSAIDNFLAMRKIAPSSYTPEEYAKLQRDFAKGFNGLPLVGDPDDVARGLAQLAELGLSGIALGFVNYADELPFFCDEVLPRLERLGVRQPR